jgi:hypothetical protein
MSPLAAILLLSLSAPASPVHDSRGHYPGAAEVLDCTFEPTRDEEFFGWPPGWTRPHGPGLPRYVRVLVDDERPPPGGRSLRVKLDGGAAVAFGPSVAVEPGVDYVLEGYVKTSALQHDAAWLSLTFRDAARAKLAEAASQRIDGTTSWQKVRVGPLAPPPGTSQLNVGIHVAPQGELQDLHGAASFGSLWVGKLPRVVLTACSAEKVGWQSAVETGLTGAEFIGPRGAGDASFLVFYRHPRGGARPIEIACLVSGLTAPSYEVRLELQDCDGRTIAQHREQFSRVQSSAVKSGAKDKSGGTMKTGESPAGSFARAAWTVPGDLPGYFRVRAEVVPAVTSDSPATASRRNEEGSCAATTQRAELGLAIIDQHALPPGSEFGWSLDPSDVSLGLVPLSDLLTQAGVRLVKYPFVCSFNQNEASAKPAPAGNTKAGPAPSGPRAQPDRIEPLISFTDQLALAGVQLVGVLHPPSASMTPGEPGSALLAVEAFVLDPKTWYSSIEPVLGRLGAEIRFWQIGGDRDLGWTACSDLPALVSRVKAMLDQIGQDLDVGMAWDLAAPLPVDARGAARGASESNASRNVAAEFTPKPGLGTPAPKAPWRFLSLPCDDTLTDAGLAKRLDATASAGVSRWLAIDALPRTGHYKEDRIAQLVGRMITAKMHGADGVFFDRPFDSERGLVGRDGSPGELFLPWRTTALMLGGLPYAGDIDLAGGSILHCFGNRGRYVGVVAAEVAAAAPQRETVYLGDQLQTCDVWGRTAALSAVIDAGARSNIDVQRLPVFLTGLDDPITEWQLNVGFAPKSLPSIPTSTAAVVLELKNTLPRAVAAHVRIAPPRNWQVEPDSTEFRLEPGATWKLPLRVVLPNDVLAGPQMLALHFELQADRLYRFIAYRPIDVTGGDVDISGRALIDDRGQLIVRQTLENHGKTAVGFRCSLLAPGRRRRRTEVIVPPHAKSESIYSLSDGSELLGKPLWLRAEEINGPRVLNYRVEANR